MATPVYIEQGSPGTGLVPIHVTQDVAGNYVTGSTMLTESVNGVASPVNIANPLPINDLNSAAYSGVVLLTPGVSTSPLRSLGFICSSSGNITLTLADGSQLTLGIAAGPTFQTLPFAVVNVVMGSGTAGQFWNLK